MIAPALSSALLAAQTISPATTSATDSGAIVTESHVPCTAMRLYAE